MHGMPPPSPPPICGAPPPPPAVHGAPQPPPPPPLHGSPSLHSPPPPIFGGAPPPPPFPGAQSVPPPPQGHIPGTPIPPGPPSNPGSAPPPPPPFGEKGSVTDGRGMPAGRVRGISRAPGLSTVTTPRRSTLKPLHWSKVTRVLQGSLWEEFQRHGEPQVASEFDVSELETLFSTSVPKSDSAKGQSGGRRKSVGSKPDKVHLTLKEFVDVAETEVSSVTILYSVAGRNADALALYFGEDPCPLPI